MPNKKTVALVGHCGPDSYMLRSKVAQVLPDVTLAMINDTQALQTVAQPGNLLLVNRVLDGAFDTDSGIELIRRLAASPPGPGMMLISNFADAQAQAVEAGALPGFGKSELGRASTEQRLREAVRDAD